MNWLERARREMRKDGTANTAKANATAVTAVPQLDMRHEMTATQREEWEERAAIMEFDGRLPRAEADRAAWELVTRKRWLH